MSDNLDPMPTIFIRLGVVAVPVLWFLVVRVVFVPELIPDPDRVDNGVLMLLSIPITILSMVFTGVVVTALHWAITGRKAPWIP
jgi:hypothetical protein